MKLVVDIGNSRLKWAFTGSGSWHRGQSVALLGELNLLLDRCWGGIAPPQAVLVANVSGKNTAAIVAAWTQANWGLNAEFFKSTASYGKMVNGYEQPAQLGCDRWAALLGARSLTDHGAICVVDCGTATTIDALSKDDKFLGGIIFPGIDLIQQSLLTGTSDITESRAEFKQVLGTTTAKCVSAGSFLGVAGAIERILGDMRSILDKPALYITGGDAPQVAPLLNYSLQYEPDLVLIGLAHTLDCVV